MAKIFKLLTILLVCALTACGGSGGGEATEQGATPNESTDGILENIPDDGGIPEGAVSDNPIVTGPQIFGEEQNLYKPRSDGHSSTPGNLVVLLSPKFTTQFLSCSIKKSNGQRGELICINDQEWTHVPFSCFSNGGRQTWRAADFTCDDVAEIKVVCQDVHQEVVFTVPETSRRAICNRFG